MDDASLLTCAWCKQPFERRNKRGPAPRFCSDAHRQAAHRARSLDGSASSFRLDVSKIMDNYSQLVEAFDMSKIMPDMSKLAEAFDISKLMPDYSNLVEAFDIAKFMPDESQLAEAFDISKLTNDYSTLVDSIVISKHFPDFSNLVADIDLATMLRPVSPVFADIETSKISLDVVDLLGPMLEPLRLIVGDDDGSDTSAVSEPIAQQIVALIVFAAALQLVGEARIREFALDVSRNVWFLVCMLWTVGTSSPEGAVGVWTAKEITKRAWRELQSRLRDEST